MCVRRAKLTRNTQPVRIAEIRSDAEKLTELGRLGARLVLQRAVEDEVTAFLGRARSGRYWTAHRHLQLVRRAALRASTRACLRELWAGVPSGRIARTM